MVHHDRMEPVRSSTDADQNEAPSDSDESDIDQPLIPEDEPAPRRYPLRERTQRVIPGAVPWSAIEDVWIWGGVMLQYHSYGIPRAYGL